MRPPSVWSQRLLRKGPFAAETFALFSQWNFEHGVDRNLARGLGGQFRTAGWEKEVRATIRARLTDMDAIRPLIQLSKSGMSFHDWRDCYRLWITLTEQPYGSFVMDWLYGERERGRYQVRAEEVRPFVTASWSRAKKVPLSEYGVVRAARDLLKTATDLGLLTGASTVKTLAHPGLGDSAFVFHLLLIAELEGSASRAIESRYWRAAFMAPSEVHNTLLRLHQYRKVDYQVAGSLIQLSLPYANSLAFAEAVAA
ncbi:MAG: hypothetical protein E5X67_08820 [Mesorhizobium sp.]|uniref:hypothetical protein n=1 Tax=Mesorhizobium sp. TaxID=1871066 RepID=UPI000FE958B4|nr:hypothetical protein [Mesorhizobium sp.]RWP15968.1 MAG: hypothetical protein EOR01_28320 [Mesorhizobium sp.]TIP29059.1 MAG: hypothetical protein E5X67_08820 [Mesorhizobium sp.]